MGWLSAIGQFFVNLLGFGTQVIANKREERALDNSPEMQERAKQAQETAEVNATVRQVEKGVQGDPKSLDDIRNGIG